MNTLFAASLIDSPWVVVVILLVGALSQWLIKRRQANQEEENQPERGEPLSSTGEPYERSPRELDLQEALRQLLGGEPPPRAPQPLRDPPMMRETQPAEAWSDEERFQPPQAWMDEPQETYEPAHLPAIQTAPPSPPHPAMRRTSATSVESELNEEAVHRFEQLNEQGRHPAKVVIPGRGHRSCEGTPTLGMLRDHRTVRQAFVASLVFGPPKAFES